MQVFSLAKEGARAVEVECEVIPANKAVTQVQSATNIVIINIGTAEWLMLSQHDTTKGMFISVQ